MSMHYKAVFIKSLVVVMILAMIESVSACAIFSPKKEALAPPLAKPKQEQYQVAQVKKGTIVNAIRGNGIIVSAMNYPLYFKVGGRLEYINVRTGEQVKKGQVLAQLDAGDLNTQVALAQLDVQKAQLNVERAQDALTNAQNALKKEKDKKAAGDPSADIGSAEVAVKNAEYGLQQAQLGLSAAKINLNKLQKQSDETKLISPINGTVIFEENVKEGDDIPAYKVLIQVADPSQMQVTFDIGQVANAMIIKPGMKAELTVNDKTIIGEVVSCPYSAPASSTGNNKALAPVVIRAPGLNEGAVLGDNVTVNIVLGKRDNTLIVPSKAVHNYMGRNYVELLNGDVKSEVDVETGIKSSTEIEILSGLKEGQQVVLK